MEAGSQHDSEDRKSLPNSWEDSRLGRACWKSLNKPRKPRRRIFRVVGNKIGCSRERRNYPEKSKEEIGQNEDEGHYVIMEVSVVGHGLGNQGTCKGERLLKGEPCVNRA